MNRRSFLPPFGKIFITSLVLSLLGIVGLLFIVFYLEPTLAPRWLFFFFLTIASSGVALPAIFVLQRRLARQQVTVFVILREAILTAIFIDLLAWMQLGRIISNLIILILAAGFILIEFFLRLAEKATFHSDETIHE